MRRPIVLNIAFMFGGRGLLVRVAILSCRGDVRLYLALTFRARVGAPNFQNRNALLKDSNASLLGSVGGTLPKLNRVLAATACRANSCCGPIDYPS